MYEQREPKRCSETVYVRDQYRYSGRGAGGFEMHYKKKRCGRVVRADRDLCWQHTGRSALHAIAAPSPEPGGTDER